MNLNLGAATLSVATAIAAVSTPAYGTTTQLAPGPDAESHSKIDALLGGDNYYFHTYTSAQAAMLDSPFFSASYSANEMVAVFSWDRWDEHEDKSGRLIKEGVSVQLFLRIYHMDADARTSTLGLVAASVSFGHASVEARIVVRGATSARISQSLPTAAGSHLDADNIVQWLRAIDDIKALVFEKDAAIKPFRFITLQPLKVDPLIEHIGVTRALEHIADQDSLADALDDIPNSVDADAYRRVVTDVYLRFLDLPKVDLELEPSDYDQKRAKEILTHAG